MGDDMMNKISLKVDSLLSAYNQAKKQVKIETTEYKKAKKELKYLEESQLIVQQVAQEVQQHTHRRVATIVSRCLNLIFTDAYEFKLIFERKRGKTEARPIFIKNGHEIDPTYSSGGGVRDVTSFALRMACMILARPRRRKLIVLDEPFKMMSPDNRDRVKLMLEVLSEELGIQIVMITHDKTLVTGHVIDLSERK